MSCLRDIAFFFCTIQAQRTKWNLPICTIIIPWGQPCGERVQRHLLLVWPEAYTSTLNPACRLPLHTPPRHCTACQTSHAQTAIIMRFCNWRPFPNTIMCTFKVTTLYHFWHAFCGNEDPLPSVWSWGRSPMEWCLPWQCYTSYGVQHLYGYSNQSSDEFTIL